MQGTVDPLLIKLGPEDITYPVQRLHDDHVVKLVHPPFVEEQVVEVSEAVTDPLRHVGTLEDDVQGQEDTACGDGHRKRHQAQFGRETVMDRPACFIAMPSCRLEQRAQPVVHDVGLEEDRDPQEPAEG